jgi:hypothetical protein
MSDPRIELVHAASLNIGVHEVGHNGGPQVERWLAVTGHKAGAPWCAAFVSAMLKDVCDGRKIAAPLCSAGAVDLYHRAKKAGLTIVYPGGDLSAVKPGFLWVRATSADEAKAARAGQSVHGHVGIVTKTPPGAATFETVEGNTNAAGSREGDAVAAKTHRWDHPYTVAFVDPFSKVAP